MLLGELNEKSDLEHINAYTVVHTRSWSNAITALRVNCMCGTMNLEHSG